MRSLAHCTAAAILGIACSGGASRGVPRDTIPLAKTAAETSAIHSPGAVARLKPDILPRRYDTSARLRSGQACGGVHINVIVRAGVLGADTAMAAQTNQLRAVAHRLSSPLGDAVGKPEISPAIRAFRLAVRDTTQLARLMDRLRAEPGVEDVSRDACNVRPMP